MRDVTMCLASAIRPWSGGAGLTVTPLGLWLATRTSESQLCE